MDGCPTLKFNGSNCATKKFQTRPTLPEWGSIFFYQRTVALCTKRSKKRFLCLWDFFEGLSSLLAISNTWGSSQNALAAEVSASFLDARFSPSNSIFSQRSGRRRRAFSVSSESCPPHLSPYGILAVQQQPRSCQTSASVQAPLAGDIFFSYCCPTLDNWFHARVMAALLVTWSITRRSPWAPAWIPHHTSTNWSPNVSVVLESGRFELRRDGKSLAGKKT